MKASAQEIRVCASAAATAADEQRVCASAELMIDALENGEPRRKIKLLPFGTFRLRDGRGPFTLERGDHARAVVAATVAAAGAQDLMIDYDHQSEFAAVPGVGGRAEASGWMKVSGLSVEDDGIWAQVEWTAPAEAKLRARAYRYISPLFGADKKTGRITRLFNAGLVNQPAIDGLPAIAAQLLHGDSMKTIAKLLGLAEDATEAQISAAITALQADRSQLVACAKALGLKEDAKGEEIVIALNGSLAHRVAAAKALGLKEDATGEEIVAAATAKSGVDPTKFVPIEGFTALQAEVATLKTDRIAAMVDGAIEAGKITPALRSWAIDYATKDEAGFAAMVDKAPALVDAGDGKLRAKPDGDASTTLSDEERQVCAAIGMTEADFLAAKKEAN